MQFITSGSLPALRVACVYLPLFLAFASMFSTQFDSSLQSQPIAGIPLFLWLWLGVSLGICTVLMWVSSRLDYQDSDFATQDRDSSQSINSLEGERHD